MDPVINDSGRSLDHVFPSYCRYLIFMIIAVYVEIILCLCRASCIIELLV